MNGQCGTKTPTKNPNEKYTTKLKSVSLNTYNFDNYNEFQEITPNVQIGTTVDGTPIIGNRTCKSGWKLYKKHPNDEYPRGMSCDDISGDSWIVKNKLETSCGDGGVPQSSTVNINITPGTVHETGDADVYTNVSQIQCVFNPYKLCCMNKLSSDQCPENYCEGSQNCDAFAQNYCSNPSNQNDPFCGCINPYKSAEDKTLLDWLSSQGINVSNQCYKSCDPNVAYITGNLSKQQCDLNICAEIVKFANNKNSKIDLRNLKFSQKCGESVSPNGGGNGGGGNGEEPWYEKLLDNKWAIIGSFIGIVLIISLIISLVSVW